MSRSEFPKKIDTFTELFDLPADKVNAAIELNKLKQKAVLDNNEQNRISALSAELQDYLITPETMNKLTDALVELETFFLNEVDGYIKNKQREWDQYVKDFNFVGVWSSSGKYKRQNLVSYSGNLYLVLKDVVADGNHTPNNSRDIYWQVAFKGDKGDIGLNAFYRGVWDGKREYTIGDAVSIKLGESWNPLDIVYIAKTNNVGKKPDISTNDWFPYSQILVGDKKPNNLHPSTHFLEIVG